MKKQCYRQSKLKKQLLHKRMNGEDVLVWKLNPSKKEDIEKLGYRVEPFLYIVQTRCFYNIKKIHNSMLKDLHYMKKNGRNYQVRTLTQAEQKILDEFGIQYYPLKYKIYLHE